jgi:hypothetical protein
LSCESWLAIGPRLDADDAWKKAADAQKESDSAKAEALAAKNKATAAAKPATDAAAAEKKAKDAASNFNNLDVLALDVELNVVTAANAGGRVETWNEASKTGQIVLEFVVNRTDLDKIPMKIPAQVLRGPLLSKIGSQVPRPRQKQIRRPRHQLRRL